MANHRLDNIILSGTWEMEPTIGFQYLAQYAHDLDYIKQGGKLEDLEYSKKRQSLEPCILGFQSALGPSELLSSSQIPEGSIAVIRLSGAMRMQDGLSSRGIRSTVQYIKAADDNPLISGILMEIDSGGGESTAAVELQNALTDVERNGKTIVGGYFQTMASAAVRGMLPARFLMAAGKSSLTGSIGTYTTVDKELLKYVQENYVDYYARQSTEKNIESRELGKGNPEPMIDMVTKVNQVFIDEVLSYRKLKGPEGLQSSATAGRTLTANEALQIGLIDAVGTFQQAVERLGKLIEQKQTPANGARGFSNNNNLDMEFKNFLASVIQQAKQKLGLEIKEDATAEETLAALEAAKPIAELIQEAKAEIQQAGESADKEMAANWQRLSDRMDALEKQKAELEGEVASLKSGVKDMPKPGEGAKVPNADQFQTTQIQFGSRLVE